MSVGGLRRELGSLESYAAMVGMLVGAGIFRVTSDAWHETGPSVILGYLVLAPAILATAVPYAAYASTSLGTQPGGEYLHIARTLGKPSLAYLAAWLKIISYLGALAYLAAAFAGYLLPLFSADPEPLKVPVAILILFLFFLMHAFGVKWFARVQVTMCVLLALSLVVLIVPGLFAVHMENYRPFFTGGPTGFFSCLPLLFFAYAGFDSIAQAGGEIKDGSRRIPKVVIRGILLTTTIFVAMSVVAFGVVPGASLGASDAPMTLVARAVLPGYLSHVVTMGALMAIATSVNATLFVPSRIAVMLAEDGLIPKWLGRVDPGSGTPRLGLALTAAIPAAMLLAGDTATALALNVAVFALVLLYGAHSLCALWLPRANPQLAAEVRMAPRVRAVSASISVASMATLVVIQIRGDLAMIGGGATLDRWKAGGFTSVELLVFWLLIGWAALRCSVARPVIRSGKA